jgi:hypothetical protein
MVGSADKLFDLYDRGLVLRRELMRGVVARCCSGIWAWSANWTDKCRTRTHGESRTAAGP